MDITIIGTGNMAKAIGIRLLSGGNNVTFHAKDIQKGEEVANELKKLAKNEAQVSVSPTGSKTDEIVIIATPYTEVTNIAQEYNGLADKIVVDITNPVDFETFQLIPADGKAGAEEVAKLLPNATVIKAFNTTFAGVLTAGEAAGKPIDVFIAGDGSGAKETVSQLIKSSGMRPIDAGPLANARHLEGIALIHMSAQSQLDTNWSSALQIVS